VNGELSYELPPLRTAGNCILDTLTEKPVKLRGVNRSGLEYSEPQSGFLNSAALSQADVLAIVAGWGANVIRLPFNQDWALQGRGSFSAESYRQALDQVISWAAALGAYTLLDLQWLDADTPFGRLSDGSVNRVAPLPNQASIELWAALAERYRDEPAVLFDLFSEPHAPLSDDQNPMCFVTVDGAIEICERRKFGPDHWTRWADKIVTTIREIHPGALAWVSGVDWGFDLRGVQIDAPNIVYSAHVYPNRSRRQWRSRFGQPCSGRPLFIGEWGGGAGDLKWGSGLIAYMRGVACGWTAWSWADSPKLVLNAQMGDYTPTGFGKLVRSELLLSST
jgi:aryl-phospho-beta-D-glucosidase BglC (GH1 family)